MVPALQVALAIIVSTGKSDGIYKVRLAQGQSTGLYNGDPQVQFQVLLVPQPRDALDSLF